MSEGHTEISKGRLESLATQLDTAKSELTTLREARDGEIEVSTLREAIESALRASGAAQ